MKCPKCGGAPTDMVLLVDPPMYQCSACSWAGRHEQWTEQAHAERLQAARDGVRAAMGLLSHGQLAMGVILDIERLIDAKVTLALLERGS